MYSEEIKVGEVFSYLATVTVYSGDTNQDSHPNRQDQEQLELYTWNP